MPRLAIYTDKPLDELIDSYELCSTDLSNLHNELAQMQAELHRHYLEVFAGSHGKSVAEKNRESDYTTKDQYAEVLEIRGKINNLAILREMLAQLISWKHELPMVTTPSLTMYPPNADEGTIGNGHR